MDKYYTKFKDTGERETSIVLNVHFATDDELQPYLDQGFIPIGDEEQELYATNQYIRDTETGEPVPKPVYVPTAEEKLTAIRAERDRLVTETDKYMLSDYPITDTEREQWKV
ncbi:phage tail assembly chaperone [Sporomusa aerivorans]|uniref:phage tail assembly chaperone n=1 Tax=Sporomusa aerivorans TaxID=204936 RepID=UPI00352A4273